MQYYTSELWASINSFNQAERETADEMWDANNRRYYERLEQLGDRLSQKAHRFFMDESVHDFELRNFEIIHAERGQKNLVQVNLTITDGEKTLLLKFKRVVKILMNYEQESKVVGYDDIGYLELLDVDEEFLSFELLFASDASIYLKFPNKQVFIERVK